MQYGSAAWIQEAPSTTGGRRLPLGDFGAVTFTDGTTLKDGQTVSIADSGARVVTMIGASRQPLAVPTQPGDNGSTFSVSRTAYAATQPAVGRGFRVATASKGASRR